MEPTNNKLSREEKENVLMVLNEFSQEYKINAKAISMLAANVKECIAKVNEYIEESKKEYTGEEYLQQIEQLKERVDELKNLIITQPNGDNRAPTESWLKSMQQGHLSPVQAHPTSHSG